MLTAIHRRHRCTAAFELELELIQTQMAQKPMLRAEVRMRERAACGLADPPYHRAKPINLLSNAPVVTLLSISISASHAVPVAIPDLFVITTVPISSPSQPLLRLCPIHSPNSDPRLHDGVFRKSVRKFLTLSLEGEMKREAGGLGVFFCPQRSKSSHAFFFAPHALAREPIEQKT